MRYSQFEVPANNTRQVISRNSETTRPSRLIIQPPAPQASFTGTEAGAQASQTVAAAGLLIFTGTETASQASQTVAAAGKEIFTGTEAKAQAAQTEADAGKLIFTGLSSTAQRAQSSAATGGEVFGGSEAGAQRVQTDSAAGTEVFTGSELSSQLQSTSAAGQEVFIGTGSTAQAPQSTVGFESFNGTANIAQLGQMVLANGTIPVPDAQMPYVGGGKRPHRRATLDLSAFLPTTIFGQSWTGSPEQKAAASGKVVLPPRMSGDYRTYQRKQSAVVTGAMLDQELEELTWLLMNV